MRAQRWTCHLVFDKSGIKRMTKGAPDLSSGEYAVRLRVSVPGKLFDRAIPEATLTIPLPAVIEPTVQIEGGDGGA